LSKRIARLTKPLVNRIVGHGEEAVDQLLANPLNYRLHPDNQQHALAGSIDDIGFIRSVTVNRRTGRVVDGHLRVTLAARSGVATLPVEYVDLSEAEEAQALLSLDPIAAMAASDKQKLDELMRAVQSDDERVQTMLAEMAEREGLDYGKVVPPAEDPCAPIDRAEELRQKWGVESGQLWQLGDHRLICGDCADAGAVDRLMAGEKAGAVVTDPPYGMNLDTKMSAKSRPKGEWENKPKHYDKVIGDDADYDPEPIFSAWGYCSEIFLWGADYYAEMIPARKQGSWLVWDKREGIEDTKFSLSSFELCWSKSKHRRDIIRQRWMGLIGTETQDVRSRVHPTQKPVEVFEWIIQKYTSPGEIVVDPYIGSGTTLIACERLGRKCRGVEISPAYVAVALERWATMTGQMPVLVN